MAAGSVRAPLIVPLRLPEAGKSKNTIDNTTRIEITSDTPNCDIYFTVDGSRPDRVNFKSRRNPKATTFSFTTPFCLPVGMRTVKAIAYLPSTKQDSYIVTKMFDVKPGPRVASSEGVAKTVPDDYGFLSELLTPSKQARRRTNPEKILLSKSIQKLTSPELTPNNNIPQPILKHSPKEDDSVSSEEPSKMNTPPCNSKTSSVYEGGDVERIDEGSQFNRLRREMEPLACPKCYAHRPLDENSVFCSFCGATLPRLPKPAMSNPIPSARKLNTCPNCGSTCSIHEDFCLVCEAPTPTREHSFTKSMDVERRLCATCGSLNPTASNSCFVCEGALPRGASGLVSIASLLPQRTKRPNTRSVWQTQPDTTVPNIGSHLGDCRGCQNAVTRDMAFCQWCGTKDPYCPSNLSFQNFDSPSKGFDTSQNALEDDSVCKLCLTENPPHSRFCCQCGGDLLPPSMYTTRLSDLNGSRFQASAQMWGDGQSKSVETRRKYVASSTQTKGLFFPSAAELRQSGRDSQLCKDLERDYRARAALLAPVSPGKGFWRMQLEHVILHLKAYTRNNPDFRKVLGIPRLGRLTSIGLNEQGSYFIMTLSFKQHGHERAASTNRSNQFVEEPSKEVVFDPRQATYDYYKRQSFTEDVDADEDNDDEIMTDEETLIGKRPTSTRRTKKTVPGLKQKQRTKSASSKDALGNEGFLGGLAQQRLSKLSNPDKALHYELRPGNKVNKQEIISLFSDGADPRSVGANGDPALITAVRNRHLEAIPVLISAGADVNCVGIRNQNTPLHEAVLLGSAAKEYVDVLLSCGADVNAANAMDRTPHDLAVQEKLEPVLQTFAIHLGQQELDKFMLGKKSDSAAPTETT